ncbi:Hypothetical transmembrane protein [Flavobacterium branchiophilum]|uniref:Hypothetical transmembrane protein n=1 Tax=Flavobacterium branchiophilum (strain FL-15) TaxID=1034807 RepID=G2Z5H7_FLABF|nr:hypothetical protein [Flavobacterium branchiophilum]CCB70775.1 Hypothetical transmembrane protein [Flavobacterium branchiophilum FL-15]
MTIMGFIIFSILIFSLYLSYKIFIKLSNKKYNYEDFLKYKKEYNEFIIEPFDYDSYLKMNQKDENIFVNIAQYLFTFLLVVIINSLFIILSYSFYWKKTFKTITENKYESEVVGYAIETSTSYTFSKLGSKILIYYPKVRFINKNGIEIIKQLDVGSNIKDKYKIGKKVVFTYNEGDEYINIINVDWISIIGTIFISVNSFFSFLVSSYPLNLNFKQRITKSFYFGILILSLNIICILILYIQM